MKKDVTVILKGTHGEGPEREKTESICKGIWAERNGVTHILFEEKDPDGDGFIKGRIKILERCVEVERKGLVDSLLIFETGKTHRSDYHSPFGTMGLEVFTHSLEMDLRGERIRLEALYDLAIDGGEPRRSKIVIEVKG